MRRNQREGPGEQDEHCSSTERIEELEKLIVKLRDSEERLGILFEHAPDAMYLIDLKGTFIDGNSSAEATTGYTRDELIGKSFLRLKLLSARDLPRAAALLAKSVAGQSTGPDEFMLSRKDGTQAHVEIRTHPIRIGCQSLVLGIARDISRRREAEQALRDSEMRSRTMMEQSPFAIEVMSPDGRILDVNAAWLELWGLPEEIKPEVSAKYNTLQDAQLRRLGIMPYIERGFAGETLLIPPAEYDPAETLESLGINKPAGRKRWIQSRIYPLTDESGRIVNVVMEHEDITTHQQAQNALREREQESQAFVETSRDWIWSIDLQGTHTYSNPAVEAILGYTPDELIGGVSLELLHPDDRRDIEARLPEWIGEKRGWRNQVLRWRHKNGDWRWLESNAVAIFDSAGNLSGFRGVDRDITERLEAEQQVRLALEGTIQAVAETIEMRDPYTAGHQRHVTKLAVAIAERLGLSDEQVEGVRVAATLHDIGKMAIPAEILSKPGKLSEQEYALIQEHPRTAHAILKGITFPWPVADIVLQHHERLNGSGYPNGLMGEDILQEAEIIAVADTVEAMSNHRPYRPALGLEEALREIQQNKGTLYDPDVVDACVRIFESGEFQLDE